MSYSKILFFFCFLPNFALSIESKPNFMDLPDSTFKPTITQTPLTTQKSLQKFGQEIILTNNNILKFERYRYKEGGFIDCKGIYHPPHDYPLQK